jgi:hypothetical protein
MVAAADYKLVAEGDLSFILGNLSAGCAALGAISLANSPFIPDEIPLATACVPVGVLAGGTFILETYGGDLCPDVGFQLYRQKGNIEFGPLAFILPRC